MCDPASFKKHDHQILPRTVQAKTKLLDRAQRIRGPIEAVERTLEEHISCTEVLHLVAARAQRVAAMNSLMA